MTARKKLKLIHNRWLLRSYFDEGYYLATNPDVSRSGIDPLKHYLKFGWKELRDPSAEFSTRHYLERYPDVARSRMNPLIHYARYGSKEGRSATPSTREIASSTDPIAKAAAIRQPQHDFERDLAVITPNFDVDFYLSRYPDVQQAGLNPQRHYLNSGWAEGRDPNADFHTAFYLSENPDVVESGMNPFVHFLLIGKDEGRSPTSPMIDRIMLKPVAQPWHSPGMLKSDFDISVVIPTYNRSHMLVALLDSWRIANARTRYSYELIFSDDGSDDDSCEILAAAEDLPITLLRNGHGGASQARNAAVKIARGAKILFMGDDIFPDPDLLNRHVETLRQLPVTDAVLGECVWHPALNVNHLMKHITEIGCEQFSFLALPRNDYTDFRHFYTCNISIDREFLLSEDIIFDERFYKCNFEDIELGYRLAQKGMKIYFLPDALGFHHHSYNEVRKFCGRQEAAGELATVFESLHPDLRHIIPLRKWEDTWREKIKSGQTVAFDFYDAVIRICQDVENRGANLPAPLLRDLSCIYSAMFAFAVEFGYARIRLADLSPGIVNQVFLDLVLQPPVVDAIDRLHKALTIPGHDALFDALGKKQNRDLLPSETRGTKQTAPALPLDAATLTVAVENLDHLQELRACYSRLLPGISFALRSDCGMPRAMTYAPQRGAQISCSALQRLLLLLELHPELDRIALSFGLCDLPEVGVREDQGLEMLERAGPFSKGKIVRIFEGSNVHSETFEKATAGRYRLMDHQGNFILAEA